LRIYNFFNIVGCWGLNRLSLVAYWERPNTPNN